MADTTKRRPAKAEATKAARQQLDNPRRINMLLGELEDRTLELVERKRRAAGGRRRGYSEPSALIREAILEHFKAEADEVRREVAQMSDHDLER